MRIVPAFLALACAAAVLSACGGSSSPASTPTQPAAAASVAPTAPAIAGGTPGAVPTSAATSAITPVQPGDQVELIGIVGTLSSNPDAIEVTRLSGAPVNRVDVPSTAVIRSATGGRIAFDGIRTSDRIIADGHISDRGDALVADDITVSAVVPGAQPGG